MSSRTSSLVGVSSDCARRLSMGISGRYDRGQVAPAGIASCIRNGAMHLHLLQQQQRYHQCRLTTAPLPIASRPLVGAVTISGRSSGSSRNGGQHGAASRELALSHFAPESAIVANSATEQHSPQRATYGRLNKARANLRDGALVLLLLLLLRMLLLLQRRRLLLLLLLQTRGIAVAERAPKHGRSTRPVTRGHQNTAGARGRRPRHRRVVAVPFHRGCRARRRTHCRCAVSGGRDGRVAAANDNAEHQQQQQLPSTMKTTAA